MREGRHSFTAGYLLWVSAVLCGLLQVNAMAEADNQLLRHLSLPLETQQIILVTAPDMDSSAGLLRRWERSSPTVPWQECATRHPVTLGRLGLAWGLGLHEVPDHAPKKREGDRKSPIGIFRLGSAFGYAANPPAGVRWPYRQATERDFFVDDPASADYNRWVTLDPGAPEPLWKSFERMHREDHLYRYGIVVEHNPSPAVPGRGSAIFLHIWKGPGQPTSGCTAMEAADLITLLQWLRPGAHPLLIQVSDADFRTLRLRPASGT